MTTTSRKDRTLAISVTQASRRFFKLSGSSNKRGTPPAKDTSGGDYSADSLNSNLPVNPLPPARISIIIRWSVLPRILSSLRRSIDRADICADTVRI